MQATIYAVTNGPAVSSTGDIDKTLLYMIPFALIMTLVIKNAQLS